MRSLGKLFHRTPAFLPAAFIVYFPGGPCGRGGLGFVAVGETFSTEEEEEGGNSARNRVSTTKIISEPNTSQRAHCRRLASSGIQRLSIRAKKLITTIGTTRNANQPKPISRKPTRSQWTTETPKRPSAKSAANVTLRPRSAFQAQPIEKKGFTWPFLSRSSAVRQR